MGTATTGIVAFCKHELKTGSIAVPLIIDGYNLLRSCGFVSDRIGPGSLERARGLFLGWLIDILSAEECEQTTVVFDSALRVPQLPDHYKHKGIDVHFATGHQDADEMIIEMIESTASPKLLIVSSDHQIQTAAKRRKCGFEDSDRWFDRMNTEKAENEGVQKSAQALKTELALQRKSSSEPLEDNETQKWLAKFLPGANTSPSSGQAPSSNPSTDRAETSKLESPEPISPKAKKVDKKPQQKNKFAKTSFAELAKRPREDSNQKNSSPRAESVRAEPIDETPPTEKVDLSSIEMEPNEFPELNLGQSMDQSELKNSMLVPDNIDQWLDDFDSQFEQAKMEIPRDATVGSPKQKPILKVENNNKEANSKNKANAKPNAGVPAKKSAQGSNQVSDTAQVSDTGQRVGEDRQKDEAPTSQRKTNDEGNHRSPDAQPRRNPASEMDVDSKQLERWNRQLKETDSEIFPPGYAEDILFAETFETDERLNRKRRK